MEKVELLGNEIKGAFLSAFEKNCFTIIIASAIKGKQHKCNSTVPE